MYRKTSALLLSMLMAMLVIPTGFTFAETSRDKKPAARPSQKIKRVKNTKASSPKRSFNNRVSGSTRNRSTPIRKSKTFRQVPTLNSNTSRTQPQFSNRFTKSPRKLPASLGSGVPGKLPTTLRPDVTDKLRTRVKPGSLQSVPRLTGKLPSKVKPVPDLSRKLPPSVNPEAFNKLDRVGKLKGLADYSKVIEKVGKKQIKPIKLEKFDPNLSKLVKSKNFKNQAPLAMKAKKAAILNLHLHGGCHWWVDMVIGCHWNMHHCGWWDICYTPGYWHCWTPCHYNVIYCPAVAGYASSAWYFGVDCMLIPDLSAYGIQDVKVNSPAERAGLKPGDLIVSINGQAIENETVMRDAIHRSGGYLELGVISEGSEQAVAVQVELQRVLVSSH